MKLVAFLYVFPIVASMRHIRRRDSFDPHVVRHVSMDYLLVCSSLPLDSSSWFIFWSCSFHWFCRSSYRIKHYTSDLLHVLSFSSVHDWSHIVKIDKWSFSFFCVCFFSPLHLVEDQLAHEIIVGRHERFSCQRRAHPTWLITVSAMSVVLDNRLFFTTMLWILHTIRSERFVKIEQCIYDSIS